MGEREDRRREGKGGGKGERDKRGLNDKVFYLRRGPGECKYRSAS